MGLWRPICCLYRGSMGPKRISRVQPSCSWHDRTFILRLTDIPQRSACPAQSSTIPSEPPGTSRNLPEPAGTCREPAGNPPRTCPAKPLGLVNLEYSIGCKMGNGVRIRKQWCPLPENHKKPPCSKCPLISLLFLLHQSYP